MAVVNRDIGAGKEEEIELAYFRRFPYKIGDFAFIPISDLLLSYNFITTLS